MFKIIKQYTYFATKLFACEINLCFLLSGTLKSVFKSSLFFTLGVVGLDFTSGIKNFGFNIFSFSETADDS